jgi:hypothetical protein
MEQRSERRFQPNQNQSVTVKVLGLRAGPPIQASMIDLSRTGMRLRSEAPIPCGTLIEIELADTVAYGSISRCGPEKDAYVLGVQISKTAPARTRTAR